MSTEFAVMNTVSRSAGGLWAGRGLGLRLWPYQLGRTTVINALALLGFLGAPEILTPLVSGLGAAVLAIGGVAPFLLDGINALILLLHDLRDELVLINAASLAPNALLWLFLGLRHRQSEGLPWYSFVAVVPGMISLLINWAIFLGFGLLLGTVAVIWLLCLGLVLAMLGGVLFGALLKRLIPPLVMPEESAAEV